MMDDTNFPHATAAAPTETETPTSTTTTTTAAAPAPAEQQVSPATERFKSCRWKSTEGGEYCTHRDVLPFAGKEGFTADSWCPDCSFYKLRRTPKKRERLDFTY